MIADKLEKTHSPRDLFLGEKETREQVKRLERAFKTLGVRPTRTKAAGIEGLATEFKNPPRRSATARRLNEAAAALEQ